MKIATWNINSVRLRLDLLKRFVNDSGPDVICLQETKVTDEQFPADAIAGLGYPHQAVRGMKGYNGVAILSKLPLEEAGGRDWCGRRDARHVSASVGGLELHNFYVPAGGDVPDPALNGKFAHKLEFLDELARWFRRRRDGQAKRMLVGDLNIAPLPADVWSHKQLENVVSHTEVEIEALEAVRKSGPWVDAVRRLVPPGETLFTWWSYRSPDWTVNNRGRRLDHVWVSGPVAPSLRRAEVFPHCRSWPKPSDHVPLMVELSG